MLLIGAAGCEIKDVGYEETRDTGCDGTRTYLGAYDEVVSMCVNGESDVGAPPDFEVVVPSAFGYYLAFPTATYYTAPNFQLSVNNTSGSLLNFDDPPGGVATTGIDYDGNLWDWSHGPVCNDYVKTDFDWYVIDGTFYGWTTWAPDCPVAAPLPPVPSGLVPSGPQDCVAGTAEFDLAVRRIIGSDGTNATLWTTPVLVDGTGFPERAWLRTLEVVSWGDATNLHLAGNVDAIQASGMSFVGGSDLLKPASGPTVVNYAAGAKPMSVLLGTASVPVGSNGSVSLPRLRLTWSCPASGSTHWEAVPGHMGYAGTVPTIYGYDHRIVFWVANDGWSLRVAPEGRYLDYFRSRLHPAAEGGRSFEIRVAPYDAIFTGRLVRNGAGYDVRGAAVTAGGVSIPVPDQTLMPLN